MSKNNHTSLWRDFLFSFIKTTGKLQCLARQDPMVSIYVIIQGRTFFLRKCRSTQPSGWKFQWEVVQRHKKGRKSLPGSMFFLLEVRTIHLKMICFTIVFLIIIAMYCMYCAYLCVPYCACLYYLGSQEFLCITKSHQQDPAFKAVAASCDTPTEWPYILMLLARVTHGIMELTLGGGLKDLQWF